MLGPGPDQQLHQRHRGHSAKRQQSPRVLDVRGYGPRRRLATLEGRSAQVRLRFR